MRQRMKVPQTCIHRVSNPEPSVLPLDQAQRDTTLWRQVTSATLPLATNPYWSQKVQQSVKATGPPLFFYCTHARLDVSPILYVQSILLIASHDASLRYRVSRRSMNAKEKKLLVSLYVNLLWEPRRVKFKSRIHTIGANGCHMHFWTYDYGVSVIKV